MTAVWLVWLSTTLSLTLWVIITSQARFGLFFFPSALPVSGCRRWVGPGVWEGLSRWTSAQFPNKSDGTMPESQLQTIPLVSLRQLISQSDQSRVFPKWLWERLLLSRTMSSVLSQVPNRRGPLAIPQTTGVLPAIPWIIRSNLFRRDCILYEVQATCLKQIGLVKWPHEGLGSGQTFHLVPQAAHEIKSWCSFGLKFWLACLWLMQLWASVELWLAWLWSATEHICCLWDNSSLQDSNLIQAAAPKSWIGTWQNIFKWIVKIQGDLTLVFSCSEKPSYPKLAGRFSCSPVCRQVPFQLYSSPWELGSLLPVSITTVPWHLALLSMAGQTVARPVPEDASSDSYELASHLRWPRWAWQVLRKTKRRDKELPPAIRGTTFSLEHTAQLNPDPRLKHAQLLENQFLAPTKLKLLS